MFSDGGWIALLESFFGLAGVKQRFQGIECFSTLIFETYDIFTLSELIITGIFSDLSKRSYVRAGVVKWYSRP